jgi:hypothetical protein
MDTDFIYWPHIRRRRPYISEARTIPSEYTPVRHPNGHATLYYKKDGDGKETVTLCVYDR